MNGVLNEAMGVFALMVSAIFLEAAPFLLLGAFLSALSEVFLTPERLTRWIPERWPVQLLFGIAAGLVFPTCECGVVPIARRFIQKGVPARMAFSYMLSAPIMNPLVMASTYVAFQGSVSMVLGRVFMAVVCAAVTASLVTGKQGSILRERNGPEETTVFPLASADECSHAGCGCAHSVAHRSRVVTVFRHAAGETAGPYVLQGFVKRSPELDRSGHFMLLRLTISCCLADAVAVGLRVQYDRVGELEDGQWLQVFTDVRPT
ncbi:MAG: hypothetical protein HGB17_18840, partial [Syntrophobacteraceae bacterium]|nr:hypothetical protein [Syntrophobacteraceae bacterium]